MKISYLKITGRMFIKLHTSSRLSNIFSRYEEDIHESSVLQPPVDNEGAAVDSVYIFSS